MKVLKIEVLKKRHNNKLNDFYMNKILIINENAQLISIFDIFNFGTIKTCKNILSFNLIQFSSVF